jgi:hypothetical protein
MNTLFPINETITDGQRKSIFNLAAQAAQIGDGMIRSMSGADQADSEVYFCMRRVYVAFAQGVPLEEAIAKEDAYWRAYAKKQGEKVDAAPKIKRGPYRGVSAIQHRWVDPEKFQTHARHIRAMIKVTLEKVK